jgi:hypothetical protein
MTLLTIPKARIWLSPHSETTFNPHANSASPIKPHLPRQKASFSQFAPIASGHWRSGVFRRKSKKTAFPTISAAVYTILSYTIFFPYINMKFLPIRWGSSDINGT